jgi:hypothetical protein
MVRTSFAAVPWLRLKEPRDVRLVVKMLVEEIGLIQAEVAQLMDDKGEDILYVVWLY